MEKRKTITNKFGNIQTLHAIKYNGCDSFINKLKAFLSICWSSNQVFKIGSKFVYNSGHFAVRKAIVTDVIPNDKKAINVNLGDWICADNDNVHYFKNEEDLNKFYNSK